MDKLIAIRLDKVKLFYTKSDSNGYPMGYLLTPGGTKSPVAYIDSLTKSGTFKPVKGK
jgi:hypothetical protein